MARNERLDLSPNRLLTAYANGIFPMADGHGRLIWLAPDPRAVIDLDRFQISRSLRAAVRQGRYTIVINSAFEGVLAGCADRPEGTWISPAIRAAYLRLHALGFAHSVEAWSSGELVGGLYGVALCGAFFGESMFHRATDASKIALVALVQRLRVQGYSLLDVQFVTDHLRQFGAVEIPRSEYLQRLEAALGKECEFVTEPHAIVRADAFGV